MRSRTWHHVGAACALALGSHSLQGCGRFLGSRDRLLSQFFVAVTDRLWGLHKRGFTEQQPESMLLRLVRPLPQTPRPVPPRTRPRSLHIEIVP
jgi:hypothetical protein